MSGSEIDQQCTKESILKIISNELAGLNLTTGDYVQMANAILDSALEKKQDDPSIGELYHQERSSLPIVTDEVTIRECNPESDFALFEKWTRDDRGSEFLLSRLENCMEDAHDLFHNNAHTFGIVCNNRQQPIGIVGFLNVNHNHNRAELRKLIGDPSYRGKGLGKKASRLWLSYGLYAMKFRKIYLYTFDSNLRNIRINEELGFRLEGVFREEHMIDGRPRDILRMSLIYR